MENETRFPHSMWNHYKNYGTRTVNHLEGWHNSLTKVCRNSNKNIFDFIRILKNEQKKFENKVLISILNPANAPKNPKKKYRDNNERIQLLTDSYDYRTTTALEFLDAISHTIVN
jgi:uncharacterized protein (UPF0147 family)